MKTSSLMRGIVTVAIVALTIAIASPSFAATTPKGKSYSTPEKAVDAFVGAVRNYNLKTLVSIFGKGSESLFETGDPVADKNQRELFLKLYDEKHAIVPQGDGRRVLTAGNSGWPVPMPIVKTGSKWAFDSAAGIEELINRRVGRNELMAIQTCLAAADAQREYYSRDRDGDGILEYAQKSRSTIGMHNGLFWPVEPGEPLSPLGEFAAAASDEGYSPASDAYHGYHYKFLFAQGPAAEGGSYDYLARDNQIGGFAILAYPASYGDSGVMTFILSHAGAVYQRDLGEQTATEVAKITTYDPGQGWTRVSDKDLEPIPAD
ncbi:MAG: DUF2950 domain-containing protein [Thermoanaerobaculia bacterium]